MKKWLTKFTFCCIVFQDKTQTTMIVMWLIELYLDHLGQLKEEGDRKARDSLQDEFRKLLSQTRVKVMPL